MFEDQAKSDGTRQATRRQFMKKTAALAAAIAGALGGLGLVGRKPVRASTKSQGLPLTIAGYKYNRVAALVEGRVKVKGCQVQFKVSSIGDMNTHLFSGPRTNDVSEVGLHPFMLAYANDDFRAYTLLPIFPLRVFRHRSVFIRTDRGIKKPQDLIGKTIATPGYSSTSLTWIRGIFQDEYGVSPKDIQWVVAAKDSSAKMAGKISQQENVIPQGISIKQGPAGKDESDLLESGEVDALFHAVEPRAFIQGDPQVARLFSDYRAVERAYFAKTGIFPIMHAVAIKKDLLKQNPWLAQAVFDAYSQAKQLDYEYMATAAWLYESLPWYSQDFADAQALMGKNYYSYGIGPNQKALDALFKFSYQQGLCKRRLTIEELFYSGSLELAEPSA